MPATTLHILRNPCGWTEEEVRQARLDAADTIERLQNDNEMRQQDEEALSKRITTLEAQHAWLQHELANAKFALSLLERK